MKTKEFKKHALSLAGTLLINSCLVFTVAAQNTVTLASVDDSGLISAIEKKADVAMGNKDWSISKLRNNLTGLKESDRATAVLPKAGNELMSSEELYEKRSKGVIMVGTYYNCGNCSKMHTNLASGAILNEDGICVTNYHVLEDIIEGRAASLNRDSLAFISTIDGKIFPITDILSYSKVGDAAIFKIDTKGEKLTTVPLGTSAKTGSKVHAITHPNGRHYFYSEGVVARNVSQAKRGQDADRMEITADYAKGSSGGPIFDSYGNLVGMVSTTSSVYYEDKPQKNLQMVVKSTIPVSTVKRLFK